MKDNRSWLLAISSLFLISTTGVYLMNKTYDKTDQCIRCGDKDPTDPFYASEGSIRFMACSKRCAILYAKQKGYSYDFDCECNKRECNVS